MANIGMDQAKSEQALRRLIDALVEDDRNLASSLLAASPALALECFSNGATRQNQGSPQYYIGLIGKYIYAGDTALHLAAGLHRQAMTARLIEAGASARATNRRGAAPLHAAAVGNPASPLWDPVAQVATIRCLLEAGADPNAQNIDGATPLHLAVRTRCAGAVQALLKQGADPAIRNKNGSLPMQLATHTTGRTNSGTLEAKAQNEQILTLLQDLRKPRSG